MYAHSASTHVDMIPALYHILQQVELNCFSEMMWFSRRIWRRLVVLLKGRLRPDYAFLLMIFKIILPYIIRVDNDDGRIEDPIQVIDRNSLQGLTDLIVAVDTIVSTKTGIECLSLEALRLEFVTTLDENIPSVFRTKTFRHGKLFSVTQAHAWVALELQADSTFYVSSWSISISQALTIYQSYQLEEMTPQSQFTLDGPPVKRKRSENALEVLINNIKSSNAPVQLQFRIQTLLFVIDRWWPRLGSTHQSLITNTLLNLIPVEDSVIPFVYLCFSAIASFSSIEKQSTMRPVEVPWTKIWMRGYTALASNTPHVSRTGAHLLLSLLKWRLLESSAITQQVGQFAQDFREEGDAASYEEDYFITESSFPRFGQQIVSLSAFSESTCALLSSFIEISDSDAALCRLHLEDAARKWLKAFLLKSLASGRRGGMSGASIKTGKGTKDGDRFQRSALQTDSHVNNQDILSLLQAISGLKARSPLIYQLYLPDHEEFVQATIEYQSDDVLRQLILSYKLPQLEKDPKLTINPRKSQALSLQDDQRMVESDRVIPQQTPSSRELKTISMLEDVYRQLETWSSAEVDISEDSIGIPSGAGDRGRIEKAIVSAKLSTVAISFQASLESNGTRSNIDFYRRAFAHLCSIIPWPYTSNQGTRWPAKLWGEVLYEIEPIIRKYTGLESRVNDRMNRVLLQPCEGSGIKRNLARQLSVDPLSLQRNLFLRKAEDLLKMIWKQKAVS
jgi:ataxia telangiectasia mutated family protein